MAHVHQLYCRELYWHIIIAMDRADPHNDHSVGNDLNQCHS
jgi:hypothetical protein